MHCESKHEVKMTLKKLPLLQDIFVNCTERYISLKPLPFWYAMMSS